jgi:hypothetical protein
MTKAIRFITTKRFDLLDVILLAIGLPSVVMTIVGLVCR